MVQKLGVLTETASQTGGPYVHIGCIPSFAGLPGEQSTMFVLDPAGNALEFKAFADDADVFRH